MPVTARVTALAGKAGEQGATGKNGLETTMALDSGQRIDAVQQADEAFPPGERMRVLRRCRAMQVTH